MKKKNLVSLSVALVFLTLSTTGLLIYFGQGSHAVEHIHAWFGVLFVGAAVFHILNNWSSLKSYAQERRSGKFQKEFFFPALITVVFAAGIGFDVPPFGALANAGKALFRDEPKPNGPEKITFDEITTNQTTQGTPLTIILQKKKAASVPVMAVWVEDSARHFVENLFLPATMTVLKEEGKREQIAFTPATLPAWQAKATNQQANYEKATPADPFLLKTKTSAKGPYYVVLEVNSKADTERYEVRVDPSAGRVFKLKSDENQLIERGLVDLE
ncbi:MAG: DUF4405 domain-containing protein [Cytophagaceae bacterium]|nr:DUF4405 domain-containing protein [Cytophagaceae bacterium]